MVGEVWICSGQSNMEFMVRSVADAETEIAEANYPQIRHFTVPKDISAFPKDELTEGHWDVCSPETVVDFTAVGYFFAREIFNEIKIPIGLINATWGGTVVETWTSKKTLERSDDFKDIIEAISSFNQDSLLETKRRTSEKYLSQLTKKIESLQGSVNNFNDVDQWMKADSDDMKIIVNRKNISLAGEWSFKVDSISMKTQGVEPNDFPCLLYNAMINPVIPYAMQGVIWYQGESNAARAFQYRKAFPMLIRDWRNHWANGDFPFYFVQLSSFNADNGNSKKGSTWAELREAQLMTLSLPNTGMAVTTDIGDSADIHPRNKQDVGKRLAAVALKNIYGKNIVCCSPLFKSMKVKGNQIILSFYNTGSGLMAKDKYGYLKGFEIAGADSIFHFAKAFIEGDEVIVSGDSVNVPVTVRYGWADDAGEDNLYNKDGYPASPFRTDQPSIIF